MRPVERGPWPVDAAGAQIQFAEYGKARPELLKRLGEYCSYCEMYISHMPEVEHIHPKVYAKGLERDWFNLLLACKQCNICKLDKRIALNDYFFPDLDNTLLAFTYDHASVETSPHLSPRNTLCADNTRRLMGLDRWEGGPTEPSEADKRWQFRLAAWDIAEDSRNDLSQENTERMRKQIIRTAISRGFFSIWMTVFADDPDMKRRFIDAFPGTCKSCFDAMGNAIPRPGGAL